MIIDAHAHIVDNEIGNVRVLLEKYKTAGINRGILVPGGMLDVKIMTRYLNDLEEPKASYIPNDLVERAMKQYPNIFYGFYCVNPHEGKSILDDLEAAVARGYVGLKLAPIVHRFSLASKIICELADLCGQLNIPFYSHVISSEEATTNKIYKLAKAFPKTKFILGHMGLGPSDMDAVQYAKKCENLYLESSQGSYVILTEALKVLGSTKLIFGSEFPMYHPSVSLESIKVLECTESERENICCNNILNLINR